MPMYEYQCRTCGYIREVEQSIKEDAYTCLVCNYCGGTLGRVISLSRFHLKGGGWEKDGYSKKGKSNANTE